MQGSTALMEHAARMRPEVESILRHRLGSLGEAEIEDATQNVMVGLLGVAGPVRDPERYIRRSARFKAIDAWRATSRGIDCRLASDDAESWSDGDATSPEQDVARVQRRQAVERALGGLEEEVRDLVVGVYVEEAPMRTVAQRAGMPVRTAWRRVGRALDQLRMELAPVVTLH